MKKRKKNKDWLVIFSFICINFYILAYLKLKPKEEIVIFKEEPKQVFFQQEPEKIKEPPIQDFSNIFIVDVEQENRKEKIDLNKEIAKAREHNRNLFIYFGAEWCGWCRTMQLKTLAAKEVKEELENFIMVYVDKDENPNLCKSLEVSGIPAYIVMDKNGLIVKREEGYRAKDAFLEWLK